MSTFEASLLGELSRFLGEDQPGELMVKLCLTYRPSSQMESTAALAWARLIAKDLGWRIYEGTYEYVYYNGYFVKLVDKGISVQAILIAWMKEMSASCGEGWIWGTKEELISNLREHICLEPQHRLYKAWKRLRSMVALDEVPAPIVTMNDDCTFLDRLEQFRNLVVTEQLAKIKPRVEEYLKRG